MKTAVSRLAAAAVLSSTSFLAAPFTISRPCHSSTMGLSQSSPAEYGALSAKGPASPDVGTRAAAASSLPLSQQHEPYSPPRSSVHPAAHYIFLVHGWLGNDLEMGYLAESFAKCIAAHAHSQERSQEHVQHPDENESSAKRVKRSSSQISRSTNASFGTLYNTRAPVRIHSVKCNVGKTHDGIKNGGTRLAHEMLDFIRSDLQKLHSTQSQQNQRNRNHDETNIGNHDATDSEDEHVTYSIVGNSLGGLYARYAISLIPRQLSIPLSRNPSITDESPTTTSKTPAAAEASAVETIAPSSTTQSPPPTSSSSSTTAAHHHHSNNQSIHLHPNVFCTTATPHLGVSQHTYLPIPRFAETIIGTGMGTTGRDLFRLNCDKNLSSSSNTLTRRWSSSNSIGDSDKKNSNEDKGESGNEEQVDEEMECIIRNMCLQEKYLTPLRNFRRRIAYANAYRTDFQVPTETAAFLNSESEVEHFVVAARGVRNTDGDGESSDSISGQDGKKGREINLEDSAAVPPFLVAVVRTEQQQPQSLQPLHQSSESGTPANELLKMSQSLDALGWTKVFIDVRNRIPLPGIPKPSWRLLPFPSPLSTMLPTPDTSLDDLIHSRGFDDIPSSSCESESHESTVTKEGTKPITVTSRELVHSTNAGETLHIPLGHTVMVANSKSETYSKLNFQGRPVMDKLAEDMIRMVLQFE
ncbi:hypothetical protein HJC23_006420 [Cyclotella cryptica]|uniref:DUF676 domain-containing protein n=1 Tax=Cyclotella cryptica TaxID=29204 RepID=A0ABD3QVQ8_9STRA|eukprot:CCRYP_001821-RA/>CCRYP_001821-RA protein AED:0.00 eAED:0.00 QI:217/-1/1/1/-1/1/1/70/695